MVYQGFVHNGMVILNGDVQIADGTPVLVEIAKTPGSSDLDPIYRLGELAAPTGIADLAANIDHYLYGHPKVADAQS